MKKIKNYIHLRAVDLSRYLSAATVSWKRKQQILFISITTFVFLGLSLLAITSAFTSRWRSGAIGGIRFPAIPFPQQIRSSKSEVVVPGHWLRYIDNLAILSAGKNMDSLLSASPSIKDSLIKIQQLLKNQ